MREDNSIILIVGIVIAVALFYQYGFSFTIFQPSPVSLKQTTDIPNVCGTLSGVESWWSNDKIASKIVNMDIKGTDFKIDSTPTHPDSCGTDSTGHLLRNCCADIKVYINDSLLYTSKKGYTGIRSGENTQEDFCSFYSDGTYECDVYNESKSGVKVNFMSGSSYCGSPNLVCRYVQNEYTLYLTDSVEFNIEKKEGDYGLGKEIEIYVILDNYGPATNGKVYLNYEVKSFTGWTEKQESFDIALAEGKNNFTYSLPITSSTEIINITPSLRLNYPTSGISGVNYIFSGSSENVQNKEFLDLGITPGGTFILYVDAYPKYKLLEGETCDSDYILSVTGDYCIRSDISGLGCSEIGCPVVPNEDYQCLPQDVCVDVSNFTQTEIVYQNQTINETIEVEKEVYIEPSFSEKYGLAGFISVILGAIILWMVIKK